MGQVSLSQWWDAQLLDWWKTEISHCTIGGTEIRRDGKPVGHKHQGPPPPPSSDLLSLARLQLSKVQLKQTTTSGPSVQTREPVVAFYTQTVTDGYCDSADSWLSAESCQSSLSRALERLHSLVGGSGHPQGKCKTKQVFTLAHDRLLVFDQEISEIVQPFQKVDYNA